MTIGRSEILMIAAATLATTLLGVSIGYWWRGDQQSTVVPTGAPSKISVSAPAPKPIYYQDPDGKPDYSPRPKRTVDGRAYKPVIDTTPMKTASSPPAAPIGTGKVLYYRNPMGLADTSLVPKKDSMGMDYIPVYEGDDRSGIVAVSPERVQMLGVKTTKVELRASLSSSIRSTGTIQPNESKLAVVTTKFDVVVEKLFVSTTGAQVRAGQPLAQVWLQTPDTTMQIGPDVITRQIDYIVALQDKNPVAIAQTANVLRQYGMPSSAIAEIRRTGRATRSITIIAPRTGTIVDKTAIEGMHFNTGDPLFKIADFSTVWLIADVAEQDLGNLRDGEVAHVSLVAYPGQTFAGQIDFIYPTLMENTRTGRVRIVLANSDGRLRQSMYASIVIDATATSGGPVLVVPDSAVIDSGTRQVVLVVRGQGRFEPHVVKIGARGDGYVEVQNGLKPGDQVVVGANFLIDAESNLRAALQSFTPVTKKSAGTP